MKETIFRVIHIGTLLKQKVEECGVELERAAAFIGVSEEEIEQMYLQDSLEVDVVLRWSKLLQYDFFRVYTQHLILYAPQDPKTIKKINATTNLPIFKKNIYTQEVIDYLVRLVTSGKKTYKQIQDQYNIPSTTIFRWTNKYGNKNEILCKQTKETTDHTII